MSGYSLMEFTIPREVALTSDENYARDKIAMFDWIDSRYGVKCARTAGFSGGWAWGDERTVSVSIRARQVTP